MSKRRDFLKGIGALSVPGPLLISSKPLAANPRVVNNTGKCNDCIFRIQGEGCVVCCHPDRIEYKDLKGGCCSHCGRKDGVNKSGCGVCIGRGRYIYHFAYNECDCGGFSPIENPTAHRSGDQQSDNVAKLVGWHKRSKVVNYADGTKSIFTYYEP